MFVGLGVLERSDCEQVHINNVGRLSAPKIRSCIQVGKNCVTVERTDRISGCDVEHI